MSSIVNNTTIREIWVKNGTLYIRTIDNKVLSVGLSSAIGLNTNNTDRQVILDNNQEDFNNQVDVDLLLKSNTGIKWFNGLGGEGTNTVEIGAGVGTILDNTDEENPIYSYISWEAQTAVQPAQLLTYWCFDENGVLQNQSTRPTTEELRTKIYLGLTAWNTTIVAAINEYTHLHNLHAQFRFFMESIGRLHIGGRTLAASTNLTLNREEASEISYGINLSSLNPHQITIPNETPLTWQHATRNGTTGVDATDLDVGNYDVGGTITPVPGGPNTSTIFVHYLFSTGSSRLLYGQDTFGNLQDAVNGIEFYEPITSPVYSNAIVTTYIAVINSATDLSDPSQAVFIHTNKFGEL